MSSGLVDALATFGAETKWREMGARDKTEARGFLKASLRREAGLRISAAVARLLLDKTGTLLELSDPGLALRRKREAARAEREQLARIDRATMGGHLSCEGRLLRGPGYWPY